MRLLKSLDCMFLSSTVIYKISQRFVNTITAKILTIAAMALTREDKMSLETHYSL